MTKYEPGEMVEITIRARVVEMVPGGALRFTFRQPDHLRAAPYPMVIATSSPDLTIERVAPAEWPPQPGDLWADGEGQEWFARRHECGDVDCRAEVELVDERGTSHHHLSPVPSALAPLTLIRRKSPAVAS